MASAAKNESDLAMWVATAIVGSSVIGAATQAYTANKAADAQVQAANQATQAQLQMFGQTAGIAPNRFGGRPQPFPQAFFDTTEMHLA